MATRQHEMNLDDIYHNLSNRNPFFWAAITASAIYLQNLFLDWLAVGRVAIVYSLLPTIITLLIGLVSGIGIHLFLADSRYDRDFRLAINSAFLSSILGGFVSILSLPLRVRFGTSVESLATFLVYVALISILVNFLVTRYYCEPWKAYLVSILSTVGAILILSPLIFKIIGTFMLSLLFY